MFIIHISQWHSVISSYLQASVDAHKYYAWCYFHLDASIVGSIEPTDRSVDSIDTIINWRNQFIFSFDTTVKKSESRNEARKERETFCLINKFDSHLRRNRGVVDSVMEWIIWQIRSLISYTALYEERILHDKSNQWIAGDEHIFLTSESLKMIQHHPSYGKGKAGVTKSRGLCSSCSMRLRRLTLAEDISIRQCKPLHIP